MSLMGGEVWGICFLLFLCFVLNKVGSSRMARLFEFEISFYLALVGMGSSIVLVL